MVEVILSAIRPVQLLAGKLIGVGILGLIQIAAVAAIGLIIAVPGGAISLPSSTFETVVLVLVYFVLGYVFYGGLSPPRPRWSPARRTPSRRPGRS